MAFRLVILFIVIGFIELYAFQAIKTFTKVRWVLWTYIFLSLTAIVFIGYQFTKFDRSVGQTQMTMITLGLLLLVLIPKLILTLVLFFEDIYRVLSGTISKISGNTTDSFIPERRRFVSQIALGIAAIPFSSLIYGMTLGKYNYKVITQQIFFQIYLKLLMDLKSHKFLISTAVVLIILKRSIML